VAFQSTVHQVTGSCAAVHCYSHDVDEPGLAYRRCFECGHLYRDLGELQREWLAGAPPDMKGDPVPPESELCFCPLCLHNF